MLYQMEFSETRMELVILSTLAAVVILAAELGDLVRRERIGRSVVPAAGPSLVSVAGLATGSPAANQPVASSPGLDRAA
jgi:hypothetical protein